MKRLLSMCGAAGFLGVALLAGGCGGGGGGGSSSPATVSAVTAPISNATVNTTGADAGTVTTSSTAVTTITPPVSAPAALADVQVSLPPSTTITAKDSAGNTMTLTSAPTFKFSAPADATSTSTGTSGVPLPVTGGFTAVKSTAVAVNVEISGSVQATFSKPITITIPAGKAPGSVITTMYMYKEDGQGYRALSGGPYTVSANGTIDITVSNLCWFVGDPEFETESGSSGSSGGTIR